MSSVDFLQQAVAYAQQSQKKATTNWLNDYRQTSLTALEHDSFPNRKKELFKYNNLTKLQKADLFHTSDQAADFDLVKSLLESSFTISDATNVVIIDGLVNSDLSSINNDRISVTQFSDCSSDQIEYITNNIHNSITERNIFTKLNASITFNGLFIEVNESDDKPVVLTYINTGKANSTNHSNLLVKVNKSKKATLIEQFISTDLSNVLNQHSQSSKFVINDNAELEHYQLNLEHEQAIHFGAQDYRLMRDARLNSFNITFGGLIKRNDIDVHHLVGGSPAALPSLYLAPNQPPVNSPPLLDP
ncbi:MAG: SufD family Fe-S cluster assembly protein, partial [Kangiellaceae bacterium]|nr:SufD family Fe-S cluster assembly protein [Kangiellaceae bacterium]